MTLRQAGQTGEGSCDLLKGLGFLVYYETFGVPVDFRAAEARVGGSAL